MVVIDYLKSHPWVPVAAMVVVMGFIRAMLHAKPDTPMGKVAAVVTAILPLDLYQIYGILKGQLRASSP